MPTQEYEHVVPDPISPQYLLDYATGLFPVLPSRNSVKKAIKKGLMLINGTKAASFTKVGAGDRILYQSQFLPVKKIFPLSLEVVYEDEHLAIINKPAGYPVSGNRYKTILNALPDNLSESAEPDALPSPQPVHRLDEATSGLLLVAKTHQSLLDLSKQFENRQIEKHYEALVIGKTQMQGSIATPLDGQEAYTNYQLLEIIPSKKFGVLSHLQLHPLTGRKHQLRKHLASLQHPILGDPLYSPEALRYKGKGLFLCATHLSFTHPKNKETCSYHIPPPKKFATLLRYFKNTKPD